MFRAGDRIGSYTLIEKIGRGTFGVVWLAEEKTAISSHKVALKLPNEEDLDLQSICQEADVWEQVKGHPNILPIIKADSIDGQIYIASEYAPDGSLQKWLKLHNGKAPTLDSAIKMTLGILSGLQHLHSKGVIHRDLKPDNILLQADTPRIADFGISRLALATSNSTQVTGTPAYMAPECFYGVRSVQTDIWAVGVILHLLLTGKLPFPQPDQISIMNAVLNGEPQIENDIPVKFQQIIRKSLQKEPNRRFQSTAEMANSLKNPDSADYEEARIQPTEKIEISTVPEQKTLISPLNYRRQTPSQQTAPTNKWKIAVVGLIFVLITVSAVVWASFRFVKKENQSATVEGRNVNAQEIPPANAASAVNEQDALSNLPVLPESNSNSTALKMPEDLPNENNNPYWQYGTVPPGAPTYIPPGSQTIDPSESDSQFRQDEPTSGANIVCDENGKCWYIVPNSPNANANVKTTPTPRTTKSPAANVVDPMIAPNETPTPASKPTPQPKNSPSSNKKMQSGKTQDSR